MTEPITETPEEVVDPVEAVPELSDEEFAKLSSPEELLTGQEEIPAEEPAGEKTPSEGEVDPEKAGEEKETETEPGTATEDPGVEDDPNPGPDTLDPNDPEPPGKETKEPGEKDPADKEGDPGNSEGIKGSTDVPVVDYKSEYEKLMAPFKANGMDMQARNVDDAIQLMKMGAGFHKKMSALKPAMRQMKLLEKNGLLDDEKLNYLIDLSNQNPEAIQKLLKDSKIDPLDIDVKADTNYKPELRKVADTELALDDVINDIRDTPTFKKTLTVVSDTWDESSQNAIATEPQIMATINGHIADGTFDAVSKRVDYERSLGRLVGVSDLDAYKQVGNAMANEGILQRVGAPRSQEQPPVQPTPATPSKQEVERKKKKRAASPVKSSRTTAEPKISLDSIANLSDEDFAKLDINKYMKS